MCKSSPPASIPPPGKPRVFEKIGEMPAQRAIFIGKCPAFRFYYDGKMPGPPVHQTNIQKYQMSFFNRHNCFGSIILHKTTGTQSKQNTVHLMCLFLHPTNHVYYRGFSLFLLLMAFAFSPPLTRFLATSCKWSHQTLILSSIRQHSSLSIKLIFYILV